MTLTAARLCFFLVAFARFERCSSLHDIAYRAIRKRNEELDALRKRIEAAGVTSVGPLPE